MTLRASSRSLSVRMTFSLNSFLFNNHLKCVNTCFDFLKSKRRLALVLKTS